MSSPELEPEIERRASRAALAQKLLLSALVVGGVGVALLLTYLHRFEQEMSGGPRVQVLSLLKPVERGVPLSEDMLTTSEVPSAYLEQRAVKASDLGKVVGVPSAVELDANATLLWTDLALALEERDLSALVQPGSRAVTVRASQAGSDPAGNGLVRPGHYIDVIVTLHDPARSDEQSAAVVLLQRVLVLAVGSETRAFGAGDGQKPSPSSLGGQRELTLSLKLEEAQLLSLARERGTLSVALRPVGDTNIVEGLSEMPSSSLYDRAARETVQRKRNQSTGPVKLTQAE
jgi:pilus assembly protein CpaB